MKEIASAENIEHFAEKNFIYVDKTEYIYNLISRHDKVFFSRPRRFGKSLTLNTIGTLFEEGVEPYFKGTWIYDKWDQGTYPVLHLSFLEYSRTDLTEFKRSLCQNLSKFAARLNLDNCKDDPEPNNLLKNLFDAMEERDKKMRVVILIDEYDAQLTANINRKRLYDQFKECIRLFYGVMKGKKQIWFLGITGVTRLKDVSIFSVGSDIKDMSYEHSCSRMIGFTRDEIRHFYIDYLKLGVSCERGISQEEVTQEQIDDLLDRMAYHYDGFCFDSKYRHKVYSTWSVNNFLQAIADDGEVKFGDYWYLSGGVPSILDKYLETHALDVSAILQDEIKISYDDFQNPTELTTINQNVLMCQTGYLTLKSPLDEDAYAVSLGFADIEVRKALSRLLTRRVVSAEFLNDSNARQALGGYDAEQLVLFFNKLLSCVAYDHFPIREESMLCALLQLYMSGAGLEVQTQKHNSKGSCDLMVHTKERHVVLELKYSRDGSDAETLLKQAAEQIRHREYGFEITDEQEVLRLALVYNAHKDQRKFTLWEEV